MKRGKQVWDSCAWLDMLHDKPDGFHYALFLEGKSDPCSTMPPLRFYVEDFAAMPLASELIQ